MKKKLVVLFAVVFSVLIMLFACGCAEIFGGTLPDSSGGGNTDVTNPPDETDSTDIRAPQYVKLDMRFKELHVEDCSSSGVTYYEIIQNYDGGTRTVYTLDTAAVSYPKYEDGCYVMDVGTMADVTKCSFTVVCKAKSSDNKSVDKTFDIAEGEAIVYDEDHCAFDHETGVFTWTPVDGAIAYRLNNSFVIEPRIIVLPTTDSAIIAPIYGENKIGIPMTISFVGKRPDLSYDKDTELIYWNDCAKSYTLDVTDGGEKHTFTLTETSFHYIPESEHIDLRLTANYALTRPSYVNGSLDFLPRVKDIKVSKISRLISWTMANGISEYSVTVEQEDGTKTTQTVKGASFYLENVSVGTVTVKIKSVDTSRPYHYAVSSDFDITVIQAPAPLAPDLSYADGKLTVSFATDPETVQRYRVTLTAESTSNSVTNVDPTETAFVSLQMDLPAYKIGSVSVNRTFIDSSDGYVCYDKDVSVSDYYGQAVYLPTPEVTVINDNAVTSSGRGFTVNVTYPKELSGKGNLSLKYSYYGIPRTETFTADKQITFTAARSPYELKIGFSEYSIGSNKLTTFTEEFSSTVTVLSAAELNVDVQKLYWEAVPGATGYVVEEKIGESYTELSRSASTEYAHGISEAGAARTYRVTALSGGGPFDFNGYTADFKVTKLYTPSVSVDASGHITFSSASTDELVTVLDGERVGVTDEVIRAALTAKDSATLSVLASREGSSTAAYIDSDAAAYTIHRIPDVNVSNIGLRVDASSGTVKWDEPENAGDCTRLLYRRATEAEEYVLYGEYDETEIDGNELSYGQYMLEVKPRARRDGYNIYLYYGDTASDTFKKDGILNIGLLSDGTGFTVESAVAPSNNYTPRLKIAVDFYSSRQYDFDLTNELNVTNHDGFMDFIDWAIATYSLTFSINYGDGAEEYLSAAKIVKASGYSISLSVEQSKANFTGSYEYVERASNNDPAQIKVTLTPNASDTLSAVERYALYYKSDRNAEPVIYYDTTELTVAAPSNSQTQYFFLGKKSDKFTAENGAFRYYKSTAASAMAYSSYTVTVQKTITPTVTVEEVGDGVSGKKYMKLKISAGYTFESPDKEAFNFEYLSDSGKWETFSFSILVNGQIKQTSDVYFGRDFTVELTCYETDKIALNSGKSVRLRIRWAENDYNGTTVAPSDWAYYTIVLP